MDNDGLSSTEGVRCSPGRRTSIKKDRLGDSGRPKKRGGPGVHEAQGEGLPVPASSDHRGIAPKYPRGEKWGFPDGLAEILPPAPVPMEASTGRMWGRQPHGPDLACPGVSV
ncbi:MAG: hypothetical protein DUD30_05615 [Lactobacillus sp.]|nr:MAG: hypothetical protein DUD30_05615 [Lactobacillus sp.]